MLYLRRFYLEVDPETLRLARAEEEPPQALCVLALWDDQHVTFPLPDRGSVTVGRAEGADVRLGDQAISRQHIKFHVGELLRVEDLGSANGTRVRGRLLKSGETVEVNPGDSIEIGRTLLVIQRAPGLARPFRIYAHDYFEARLDDECARAERGDVTFAVLRVHDGGAARALIHQRLVGAVRPGDVVATYGPGEHELLFVDCDARAAKQRSEALLASLQQMSASTALGLACSPRDGHTSASLLAHANAALRGLGFKKEEAAWGEISSGTMDSLRRIVERIARSSISVLITGETGVGKGVLAQELHRKSPRASRPLVALNCAELPESLLEAELFGYEKGAFTGADKAKAGLIETADEGTLVLDEVGDLSLGTQARLLRVLEDHEVRRIGSLRPRRVDLRVVACTNRDLEADTERGTFRRDLYFRLAGISLVVPPLRERTEEIEGLARAFLVQAKHAAQGKSLTLTSEALAALRRCPWPGNVRELRNVMERAALLSEDGVIRLEHVPVERLRTTFYPKSTTAVTPPGPRAAPRQGVESEEGRRILDALAECGGNQSRAAKRLGISRRTLVTRLKDLGLPRPRK